MKLFDYFEQPALDNNRIRLCSWADCLLLWNPMKKSFPKKSKTF